MTASRWLGGTLLCVMGVAPGRVRADELVVLDLRNAAIYRYDADTGEPLGYLVRPRAGGIDRPHGFTFGPDGKLYVASHTSNNVTRFDSRSGKFLDVFLSPSNGGPRRPVDVVFGPDGNLYVNSFADAQVLRYDGRTGAFLGVFVSPGSGGLERPELMIFGPDGHFYVSCATTSAIYRYDGQSGAFIDAFVPPGSGGLDGAHALLFAPDGYLYVPSFNTAAVLRFDGQTGVFDSVFVSPGSGGLVRPHGMILGPDGNLNVCSFDTGEIKRYDGTTGALLGEAIVKHPRGPRGPTVVVRVPNLRPRLRPLDPGFAGIVNRAEVPGATPGATVRLYAGERLGVKAVPGCAGLALDLESPRLVAEAVAGADGVASMLVSVPAELAGRTFYGQAVEVGTCLRTEPRAVPLD